MATDIDFIEYVKEQAGLSSRLTCKKMFGEYALYLDGKVVAFACDNSLFLKPTDAAKRHAPGLPQRPPYPGAKLYPVVDELLDDAETLQRLILDTASLLPLPKKKMPKKANAKTVK
jgi:TfoX/Sxy family transcriptional regulator of competence genes